MSHVSDFSWLDLGEEPASTQAARASSTSIDPYSARLPSNARPNSNTGILSGRIKQPSAPQPTTCSDLDFEHEMLVWQFSKLTPRTKARVVRSMRESIEEGCRPVEQDHTTHVDSCVETVEPLINTSTNGRSSAGAINFQAIGVNVCEDSSFASKAIERVNCENTRYSNLEYSVPPSTSSEPSEANTQYCSRESYNPHLSWMSMSSANSSRPWSFASSSARDSIISNRTSMSSFVGASPRNSGIAFSQPASINTASVTQKDRPIACRFAPACTKTFGRIAERNRHEKASCKFNDARESVLCQYCINACDKECQPDCDRDHVFKSGRKDKMYAHWRAMHKDQTTDADFEYTFTSDHLDDD